MKSICWAGLCMSTLGLVGCTSSNQGPTGDAGTNDASDAAPVPDWLQDAGLVTRPPVQRPLRNLCGLASNVPDLPLGNDSTSTNARTDFLAAATDLGVSLVRREFYWADIEPMQGQYDFSQYDALVAQAAAANIKLFATLRHPALWSSADPQSPGTGPPKDMTQFAAFAGQAASHFKGQIAGWEVWAEENVGALFWSPTLGGDPVAYATMLEDAHDAIAMADPGTPVVFGGGPFDPQLVPGAIQFQSQVFAAKSDVGQKFDKMGLHPYEMYPPHVGPETYAQKEAPLEDKLAVEAWVLGQHGAANAPVWITALGWPVTSDNDEAAQARYLVRATILAARAGAETIYWYTLRDGPNPQSITAEDAFGLMNNDGQFDAGTNATPKRAYHALKAALAAVGARWPKATPPNVTGLPPDGYAVAFTGTDAGTVVTLWTTGSMATVTLPDIHGNVVDELGMPVGPSDPGVTIGPDPVYVVP